MIFDSGRKQRDIAAALEMDPGHLSRIVNGLNPSDDTKRAIAEEVGVPLIELWPSHHVADATPAAASDELNRKAA